MDYEKKYKDALERAKRWADGTLMPPDDSPETVAVVIFPELTESEDERMMREFNDWLCEEIECRTNDLRDEKDRRTLNMLCYILIKVKDWLEKQKESLHIPETCKENPDSFISENDMKERIELSLHALKDWINRSEYMLPSQKKRAIAEIEEQEAWIEKCNVVNGKLTYQLVNYDLDMWKNFENGKNEILNNPEKYGLQKPVEWSDEFDMMFEEYCDQHPEGMSLGECAEFFYERGKQAGLSCTTVEWSEEDKRVIRDACCWIAEYAGFLMSENKDKAEMLWKLSEKLKSLRPRLSDEEIKKIRSEEYTKGFNDAAFGGKAWKPSEEQMKALERASTNKYLSAKQFDILVSLYEDLQKLI